MPHRFPVKDIAHQAGLGTATVDRVLNNRPGVRRQTANRVVMAIRELEAQESQLSMRGRKLMVDLVVEAPQAFLDTLQDAVAQELPLMRTAIFRMRNDLRARFPVDQIVFALSRIERLKSDGVIVMAPDAAPIRKAVDQLVDAGIPVVTLATDMPATKRATYVGLDNHRAGETAAWLIRKWAASDTPARVLVTKRNEAFRGEEDREAGFRKGMATFWPQAQINLLVQAGGQFFAPQVAQTIGDSAVAGIYSIGGGNRAILDALSQSDMPRPVIVGHDLDPENREFLVKNKMDAVLYHDLAEDIRNAFQTFISVHSGGAIAMPENGAILRVFLPPMVQDGRPE
ncbi:LacI family DNA-binding transcriptional regulator [Rhodobacteraceae bacterium]|nr:LacI family DNA-binding transcriptional regulator [Paracoccaceae bacterium]